MPVHTVPHVEVVPVADVRDLPPRPAEQTVEVWMLDRRSLEPLRDVLAASLSPEECARRDRFVREVDRIRFELFRGMVRRLLAGYLGDDPAALQFELSAGGKPALQEPWRRAGLEFNLSHSDDVLALACARRGRLGVDVECHHAHTDVDGVAAHFFHERESAALAALEPDARRARFFAWWTAKEAMVKAWGDGLAGDPGRLDFSSWTQVPAVDLADGDGTSWLGYRFGCGSDVSGTLVAEHPVAAIRFRPTSSLSLDRP